MKRIATAASEAGGLREPDRNPWNLRRLVVGDSLPNGAGRVKQTVLLLESETIMRGALASVLRQLGYRVMQASVPVEAQRLAQRSAQVQLLHTASDIPLSAFGAGASLFTGVMDNTDVFFKTMQAALGRGRD